MELRRKKGLAWGFPVPFQGGPCGERAGAVEKGSDGNTVGQKVRNSEDSGQGRRWPPEPNKPGTRVAFKEQGRGWKCCLLHACPVVRVPQFQILHAWYLVLHARAHARTRTHMHGLTQMHEHLNTHIHLEEG